MERLEETCIRARSWISLEVDQELSEIESWLLRAHVTRCHRCRSFRRRVSLMTGVLRDHERVTYECPVVLPPRRRRIPSGGPVWAIAASIIVALGTMVGTSGSSHRLGPKFEVTPAESRNLDDIRTLRRKDVAASVAARQITSYQYASRSWLDR
jgi:predicted anti-sigma-YlaC factor YlaD